MSEKNETAEWLTGDGRQSGAASKVEEEQAEDVEEPQKQNDWEPQHGGPWQPAQNALLMPHAEGFVNHASWHPPMGPQETVPRGAYVPRRAT